MGIRAKIPAYRAGIFVLKVFMEARAKEKRRARHFDRLCLSGYILKSKYL